MTIVHQDGARSLAQAHRVRDTVSPNVGRIYFSLDSEEKRFIVNHVGLHL